VAPAARLSQAALGRGLKSGARVAAFGGGLGTGRLRGAMVVVQVALAMVLLCCAGVLARSFALRTRVSGFDPSHVLTAKLSPLPSPRIPQILERIRAIPGVAAVACTTSFSYEQLVGIQVEIAGRPAGGDPISPLFQSITPEYFRVLNQPLYRGRAFTEGDGAASPRVAIVSQRMARQFFPAGDALGSQIRFGKNGEWRTIVGVAADVPMYAADSQPAGAVYAPYTQFDMELGMIAVRTTVPPQNVAANVRAVIRAIEPSTPVIRLETMRADLSSRVASPRFYTVMLGLFAGVALALAALGVYGVVSFAVTARTHEIGVRMALGAATGDVLRAMLREGAGLAAVGAALGLLCSLAVVRALTRTDLLFHVKPNDPLTFACVPAVLFAAAMIASYAPARRAARVDPAIALRNE
jgi:putative ABC transport system permease protein